MNYTLHNGNSAEILKQYPDNHFDSVVTDPPYLIGFLGKEWDKADNKLDDVYRECLRVLKPGGHILAFSAARTYHHLAMTLERVGFEIRDQIMWIYSSGFPKSQDVGRNIDRAAGKKGNKGPLKRGAERMINATDKNGNRDNSNGVWANEVNRNPYIMLPELEEAKQWSGWGTALKPAHEPICMGRKPMKLSVAKNCQEWGVGAINVDATRVPYADEEDLPTGRFPSNVIGELPDYQKYFYCPKVSRKERHIGHKMPDPMFGDVEECYGPDGKRMAEGLNARTEDVGNNHPTVKPIDLMAYLVRLVTKKNGTVLDPFNGSGSTGLACVREGMNYVGIDLDQNYINISEKRIQKYKEIMNGTSTNTFDDLFDLE